MSKFVDLSANHADTPETVPLVLSALKVKRAKHTFGFEYELVLESIIDEDTPLPRLPRPLIGLRQAALQAREGGVHLTQRLRAFERRGRLSLAQAHREEEDGSTRVPPMVYDATGTVHSLQLDASETRVLVRWRVTLLLTSDAGQGLTELLGEQLVVGWSLTDSNSQIPLFGHLRVVQEGDEPFDLIDGSDEQDEVSHG